MKCTDCGHKASLTYSNYWHNKYGYIIQKHEHICPDCAAKRPHFGDANEAYFEKQPKKCKGGENEA